VHGTFYEVYQPVHPAVGEIDGMRRRIGGDGLRRGQVRPHARLGPRAELARERGLSLGGRQVASLVLAEDHEKGNGSVCREIGVANAVRAASAPARVRRREPRFPQFPSLFDDRGLLRRVDQLPFECPQGLIPESEPSPIPQERLELDEPPEPGRAGSRQLNHHRLEAVGFDSR